MTLEEMSKVDPRTVDKDTLVRRDSLRAPTGKGKWERTMDFIENIGNPYCYLEGDTIVKISFSGKGGTIEDCVRAYLGGL